MALLGALVLGGLLAIGAPAGAVPPDHAQNEHARVEAFWTPERIAQAVPRDVVLDPASRGFRPAARPGGGGGGGGGGTPTSVLGASWTAGGAVLKTTGKVFFQMGSSYYVCTGSVVSDGVTDRSLVLTAAHCVYDETSHTFATNWMFVPDYDSMPARLTASGSFCASTSMGCWVADDLVVHDGFASESGFTTNATLHDFAFAVVSGGGLSKTAQLDATAGAQAIAFTDYRTDGSITATLFGYPASQKYKGNDLVYSRGPLGSDPYNGNLTYRVASDQTGGSSGGPWFVNFSDTAGTGTIMSLNSHGYNGVTAMHGPKFNADTQALYNEALTAVKDTIVG